MKSKEEIQKLATQFVLAARGKTDRTQIETFLKDILKGVEDSQKNDLLDAVSSTHIATGAQMNKQTVENSQLIRELIKDMKK